MYKYICMGGISMKVVIVKPSKPIRGILRAIFGIKKEAGC